MNTGKVSIVFDISNPDEKYDFEMFMKADAMYLALEDVRTFLRDRRKHDKLTAPERKELDAVWEKFWEIIKDNGLEL